METKLHTKMYKGSAVEIVEFFRDFLVDFLNLWKASTVRSTQYT